MKKKPPRKFMDEVILFADNRSVYSRIADRASLMDPDNAAVLRLDKISSMRAVAKWLNAFADWKEEQK